MISLTVRMPIANISPPSVNVEVLLDLPVTRLSHAGAWLNGTIRCLTTSAAPAYSNFENWFIRLAALEREVAGRERCSLRRRLGSRRARSCEPSSTLSGRTPKRPS